MSDANAPTHPASEGLAAQETPPPVRVRRRTARITTEEQWEAVRAELLPMYIERRTLAEIAEAFGVSVNTAGAWRSRLVEDLRNEASSMQPRDYVMESITSLRMARAEAWRTVHESADIKDRRAGLHLVAQVENQSAKLGAMIGLYGRAGDRPLQTGGGGEIDDDARLLRSMMIEFLEGNNAVPPEGTGGAYAENGYSK